MFEGLKNWWAARPKWEDAKKAADTSKITICIITNFTFGSTKTFKIDDWSVVYTFTGTPPLTVATNGALLRTIMDPKYKDCWSGDVFAVKVLIKSGEINERNFP